MGQGQGKPGCASPSRFRGFGPQWNEDLCNMGYKIVSTDTVPEATTIKATDLVEKAFDDGKQLVSTTVNDIENSISGTYDSILKAVEIIMLICIAIVCIYIFMWIWKIYKTISRCCICNKRTRQDDHV